MVQILLFQMNQWFHSHISQSTTRKLTPPQNTID